MLGGKGGGARKEATLGVEKESGGGGGEGEVDRWKDWTRRKDPRKGRDENIHTRKESKCGKLYDEGINA